MSYFRWLCFNGSYLTFSLFNRKKGVFFLPRLNGKWYPSKCNHFICSNRFVLFDFCFRTYSVHEKNKSFNGRLNGSQKSGYLSVWALRWTHSGTPSRRNVKVDPQIPISRLDHPTWWMTHFIGSDSIVCKCLWLDRNRFLIVLWWIDKYIFLIIRWWKFQWRACFRRRVCMFSHWLVLFD